MPVYEYRHRGKVILRRVPVAERDRYPGRVTIPSRLTVCPRGEPTQGEQVLRGFYEEELKTGSKAVRQTERALGLNHHKVKSLWKHPRNNVKY